MGGYFSEADIRVFGQQQRRKNHGVTVLHLNAALGFRLGEAFQHSQREFINHAIWDAKTASHERGLALFLMPSNEGTASASSPRSAAARTARPSLRSMPRQSPRTRSG